MSNVSFGESGGNPAVALACLRAVEGALYFVRGGLFDFTGRSLETSFDVFEMAVKNKLLELASGGGLVPKAKVLADAWKDDAWETALKTAHRSMLVAYKDTAKRYTHTPNAPLLGILGADVEMQAIVEITGSEPVELVKDDNPLAQAFHMAEFNVLRSEQRLTLLYVLAEVARGRAETINVKIAEEQLSGASRHLWRVRHQHLTKVFALGSLVGGSALESAKATAKNMYREGVSVIELLQVDGVHPGRYPCSVEDNLRAAIKNA